MRNIKLCWGILLLFYGTLSNSQTPQFPFELQDGYLPSYAMHVFTGSEADTSFQRVKSKVIRRLNRDSNDLRISPDSLMWLRFVFKNTTKDSIWRLAVENNNIRQILLFNRFGQAIDSGGYSVKNKFNTEIVDYKADSCFKVMLNQHNYLAFRLGSAQTDTYFFPKFRGAVRLKPFTFVFHCHSVGIFCIGGFLRNDKVRHKRFLRNDKNGRTIHHQN